MCPSHGDSCPCSCRAILGDIDVSTLLTDETTLCRQCSDELAKQRTDQRVWASGFVCFVCKPWFHCCVAVGRTSSISRRMSLLSYWSQRCQKRTFLQMRRTFGSQSGYCSSSLLPSLACHVVELLLQAVAQRFQKVCQCIKIQVEAWASCWQGHVVCDTCGRAGAP